MGKFTPSQQRAYDGLMHDTGHSVLSAPAGYGKTYLISRIVEDYLKRGKKVALTGTTHASGRVLESEIAGGVEYQTIYSLLAMRVADMEEPGSTSICRSKKSMLDFIHLDLIIVDECSLVQPVLLGEIERLLGHKRVIFCGDPGQLLSITASGVSETFMLPSHYELTEPVRQGEGSPILELGKKVRNNVFMEKRITGRDLIVPDEPTVITKRLHPDIVVKKVASMLNNGEDTHIVCFHNEAVHAYNRAIHYARFGRTKYPFKTSEVIIDNDNNQEVIVDSIYESEHLGIKTYLINGEYDMPQDHRLWKKMKKEAWKAWRTAKPRHKKQLSEDAWKLHRELHDMRSFSCSTIFKIQGKTISNVVVNYSDLKAIPSTAQFNRAVYVGITRPTERLLII